LRSVQCDAIIDIMLRQLIVRNLEEDLVLALKRRAAKAGRSAEAEHREILRAALAKERARPSFKRLLAQMPSVGRDDDFAMPRDLPREPAL
jgi:plasmid stability protein